MYCVTDYGLSDHVLRLQKEQRERDRQNRIKADRPKKRIRGYKAIETHAAGVLLSMAYWGGKL
jgi:hypothetical protein